jgi:tetratricopeptide (TPR) repeat protein
MTAMLRDDSASWHAFQSLPAADLASGVANLRFAAFLEGRGVDSLLAIARRQEAEAATHLEAATPRNAQFWLLMNTGRPTAALRVAALDVAPNDGAARLEHLQLVAWSGFAWDADREAGSRAVEELRAALEEQARRPGSAPPAPFLICTVALLDLLGGRTDWAARVGAWLERGAEEFPQQLDRQQARSCPIIIAAATAHALGARDVARARLAELETFLRESPFGAKRLRSAGNIVAAIMHEHYGDAENALMAWQRLQDTMAPNMLTTALREEARLLDALGRQDEARSVYRRYLLLRRDAEPALRHQDEPILRRLGELGADVPRSE